MNRAYFVLVCLLVGCESTPSEPRGGGKASIDPAHKAGQHIEEPAHEALPKRIRLSPEVIKRAAIKTAPAMREVLASTVALPGEITADPDRSARVSSPVAGRLEQINFKEGSSVKKGEVLAFLRVPDLGHLRSSYEGSTAKANAARSNVERLKKLQIQRLVSEQAVLDAAAMAESLALEARAAQQQLTSMGAGAVKGAPAQLALRAAISGTVVSRNAVVGQPVTADQTIAEIVDLSELWFLGRVFEKDLGSVTPGAGAEVQINAFPEQRFPGSVEYVSRRVDPIARTLTARIRLQNSGDRLSVGLFGIAFVSAAQQEARGTVLVVPRGALTNLAGETAVFVRQANGDFESHAVEVGDSSTGKVQILSGLREGEQVVVEGVFTLKSSVLKSTFAEDE